MDDALATVQTGSHQPVDPIDQRDNAGDEVTKLRNQFQARLVAANLRTEAVRAGMVDLDGLKLVDLSAVRIGDDDKIVDGRKLMDELRRNKPWLFNAPSSSSGASVPASNPVRQKSVLEMTDEEYAVARKIVTKFQY